MSEITPPITERNSHSGMHLIPPSKQRARRMVTLRDIAAKCGVSAMTVSRALRGDRKNVSQAIMDMIVTTAQELGYDPTRAETPRRMPTTMQERDIINHVIGLFFPDDVLDIPYFGSITKGIMDTLRREDFALLSMHASADAGHPVLPRALRRGDIDGAIILPQSPACRALLPALRDEASFGTRPVVSLLEPLPGCSAVMPDDYTGGYASVSHLIQLGHRHMLHFFDEEKAVSYAHHQRLVGYQRACIDNALIHYLHLHACPWNEMAPQDAASAVAHLLRERPEITAVLAPNDTAARHIWHALTRAGLRVPEDISLVGYGDYAPILDGHGANVLTSVHMPLGEISQTAARLTIRQVYEPGENPEEQVVLPVSLAARASTGPAPTR